MSQYLNRDIIMHYYIIWRHYRYQDMTQSINIASITISKFTSRRDLIAYYLSSAPDITSHYPLLFADFSRLINDSPHLTIAKQNPIYPYITNKPPNQIFPINFHLQRFFYLLILFHIFILNYTKYYLFWNMSPLSPSHYGQQSISTNPWP